MGGGPRVSWQGKCPDWGGPLFNRTVCSLVERKNNRDHLCTYGRVTAFGCQNHKRGPPHTNQDLRGRLASLEVRAPPPADNKQRGVVSIQSGCCEVVIKAPIGH
jgi:hypothetical protein